MSEDKYQELNIQSYLGLSHSYSGINCITLLQQFYKQELRLAIEIPNYAPNRTWFKQIDTEFVDIWTSQYGIKIPLTGLKKYDLIAFKAKKSNKIIHFGLYLGNNTMLHIEENSVSKIERLSYQWLDYFYSGYRHNDLV